jgi:hypothetical protein
MKSFKAMMSEVAQPEPAEEKAFKAQHTVVADKHPVALETQHKGTKPKAKRKADQEGDANYDLAYESVELDEGEDNEPASPDEGSMAMKQADFLAYVAREMKDHLKSGKEFPEWMQNKLSKLQQAAQDLHSNFGDHGGNEDDMDEALSPKQKKIDHNKNGKIDGEDLAAIRAKKSVDEAQSHQAKTTMKHISNPTAGEKKAAADIKPGIPGVADRIAMLASAKARGALKKEAAEKPVSPFDLNNYKSQIPTKAGEKAGFDSKKVSTGTVYSRKPVKEAAYEKDMDDKKKVVVKGVKGMKSTPFTKTFRNMAAYDKWSDSDAAGDYEVHQVMHEEVELDEAFKAGIVKLKDNSSMVLKKEDADVLNKLLGGMSAGSVKKMTETAMKDKNGFAEILAFAKEAV